jgi:hypothetical protein
MAGSGSDISLSSIDQTATSSPIEPWSENYGVTLKQMKHRDAPYPTLQSFSSAQAKSGEWVLFGGRTNGLHKFPEASQSDNGKTSFPPSYQNERVWVYDPVRDRSWSRPLSKSGLSASKQLSLSTTNAQDLQQGNVLYHVGGYVYDKTTDSFQTRNRLSAIDINDMVAWAKGKTKQLPGRAVLSVVGKPLQVSGQNSHYFAVTGGNLLAGAKTNQAQLIFGQDFQSGYGDAATSVQIYTQQVRNFRINYDREKGKLSYQNNGISEPSSSKYNRRDGNVVTQLTANKRQQLTQHGEAIGGVFYGGQGVYTVPVQIDLLTGQPTMANANDPATFRQGINQYTAANVGLYSRQENSQTNLVFGGISALTLDPNGNPFFNTENPYPFTSQIAAIKRNAKGEWSQSIMGRYPALTSESGEPLTFGASSAFLPLTRRQDPRVRYLADGVVDLDRLRKLSDPGESVLIGYVVGGIKSQVADDFSDPATYGSTNWTQASGEIFKVMITPT